ncbi:hypothetical protein Tco_1351800 [Tanacetum coccineum]
MRSVCHSQFYNMSLLRCPNRSNKMDIATDTVSKDVPTLMLLESYKDISVADKIRAPLYTSFRRDVRGGAEASQLAHLSALLATVTLSQSE